MICFDEPDQSGLSAIYRGSGPPEGEDAYNARQIDRAMQRTLSCNYERFGTGGPNSVGVTWRRLLPGACREGSFVGRDGLNRCGGALFAAAALHPECGGFFPPNRR